MEVDTMSDRLIPEISEYEMAVRSDMMRLYASRAQGDAYLPAPLVHMADYLLDAGWVVAVGNGYTLTDDGVKAWGGMIKALMITQRNPATNELRVASGLPLIFRSKMLKSHVQLLQRLQLAGGSIPIIEYDDRKYRTLIKYRLIIVGDDAVTITAAGRVAVQQFGGEI